MRSRDQPSIFPSTANSNHAPKKVTHMAATGNHSCVSTLTLGTSARTSAGSAILITHQLMPWTRPAGVLAKRATSTPSSRQVNNSSSADMGFPENETAAV